MVLTNRDWLVSLYSSFYLVFRPKHWRYHQGHLKGQVFATALGGCAPSQQWFCAAVKGLCSPQEKIFLGSNWMRWLPFDFPSPSFPTYNHWMSLDHASKIGKVQQTYCSCTRILTKWQTEESIQGRPFLLLVALHLGTLQNRHFRYPPKNQPASFPSNQLQIKNRCQWLRGDSKLSWTTKVPYAPL